MGWRCGWYTSAATGAGRCLRLNCTKVGPCEGFDGPPAKPVRFRFDFNGAQTTTEEQRGVDQWGNAVSEQVEVPLRGFGPAFADPTQDGEQYLEDELARIVRETTTRVVNARTPDGIPYQVIVEHDTIVGRHQSLTDTAALDQAVRSLHSRQWWAWLLNVHPFPFPCDCSLCGYEIWMVCERYSQIVNAHHRESAHGAEFSV